MSERSLSLFYKKPVLRFANTGYFDLLKQFASVDQSWPERCVRCITMIFIHLKNIKIK